MALSPQDRAMVRLYMAGCFHYWDQLPDLAREYYASGASGAELRGCVRHLIVFAGYGPCLAATLGLHKAKLLPEDTPAKVDGPPGNAFELVYGGVTDRVRQNMHAADPALGEWIRLHLYGDLYSSPGLDLRQKQLLTCAFLAEAAMPDQLFGHSLAGLRFGNSYEALHAAARLACEMGPRPAGGGPGSKEAVLKSSMQMLDMAYAKYGKDMAAEPPACPEVEVQDAEHNIRIPALPPLYNTPKLQEQNQQQGRQQEEDHRPGDASVAVAGLRQGGPSKATSGWGTSTIPRPGNLAVDAIAARMEQQRAASGLFWDSPGEQLGKGEGEQSGLGGLV